MKKISGRRLFSIAFILLMVINFSINVNANSTYAEKSKIIEDSNNFFSIEEKAIIENEVNKLPEVYKIIVLPNINGNIEDVGQAIFEHRKLSTDTILIVLVTGDKQIYAMTGEALQKKGLDKLFFEQEIKNYFVQNTKNDSVAQALIKLTQGISNDIPYYLVKEKNSPKIPDTPEKEVSARIDKDVIVGYEYIYIFMGLLIIIFIWWLLSKKLFPSK